jgi:hypothetical protein
LRLFLQCKVARVPLFCFIKFIHKLVVVVAPACGGLNGLAFIARLYVGAERSPRGEAAVLSAGIDVVSDYLVSNCSNYALHRYPVGMPLLRWSTCSCLARTVVHNPHRPSTQCQNGLAQVSRSPWTTD